MKKYFIILAAALAISCQKDNTDNNLNLGYYTNSLTINVGENSSRAFDSNLKWEWEQTDEIIGFQNAWDKTLNTLKYNGNNSFFCQEFIFSTEDIADFHFFYPSIALQNDKTLVAPQNGTWTPILIATTPQTTLEDINEVEMQHLSAALEVRVWEDDKTTPKVIKQATLSSEKDFIGKWSVNDDLTYTQTLNGKEIAIDNLPSGATSIVFNMPSLPSSDEAFNEGDLTLTITTASGATKCFDVPALTYSAGKRTILNVIITSVALPESETLCTEITNIVTDNNSNTIKFITNSDITNTVRSTTEEEQSYSFVVNGTTLEIHTNADEFMAPSDCGNMFRGLSTITSINFNNAFNTSNVTNMSYMFSGCEVLTALDVSNFDTSNVTNMYGMFNKCRALKALDLSNFDTSNVTTMGSMFQYCGVLTSVDISSFNTANVTNMSSMFFCCYALKSLDVSHFNTSNVTNMSCLFGYCQALTSLDVKNFDTSKVTNMQQMFDECNVLSKLDVSNFDTSNVTKMGNMFRKCKALKTLDLSNFNTSNVTSISSMFNDCLSLTSLDLNNFDTSNVTNMSSMFRSCSSLTTLAVSKFNTSNVTNMSYMFDDCAALTTLDISNFDTSNITNIAGLFSGCKALATLDVSNFNTSNVTNMSSMFYNCNSLSSLDLTKFTFNGTVNCKNMLSSIGSKHPDGAIVYVTQTGYDYLTTQSLGTQTYTLTVSNTGA
ncbi:MAG: BspA family leucine-rich repeat surface protein [Alistipes sp.]|nr:BspA family leucine-rich repeat surface protein [Alistipes sp.]